MPKITGSIVDAATGEPVPARVQVLVSTGETVHPPDAILKVGPGAPFFYADGAFEVEAPEGRREGRGRARHRVRPRHAVPGHPGERRGRRRHQDGALERASPAGLASRKHPPPLRRKGKEARRAPLARPPHRGPPHDGRQYPQALGPRVREQQVRAGLPYRVLLRTPPRPERRGEPPQRQRMGYRLRPRHAAQHSQRGSPREPGSARGRLRPGLSAPHLRLRRCPQAGRRGHLVPQRPGHGGPGRRRAGQAGRVQPVRPLLDGRRVRHLLPHAQRRHTPARLHRLRLVHQQLPTACTPTPADPSSTSRGWRRSRAGAPSSRTGPRSTCRSTAHGNRFHRRDGSR